MRLLLVLLLVVCWLSHAQAERIALLVGNADYNSAVGELDNPHNDVQAIKSALLKAGFSAANIKVVRDASRNELLAEVDRFADRAERLSANDIAFFYYSGHGARQPRSDGMSLIPVDIQSVDSDYFWYETVDLNDDIIDAFVGANGLRSSAAWVVAIDACRNELRLPQKSLLGGGSKSFGGVPTTSGMLISFAADTGETAADKVAASRRLSPYAKVLSEELVRPGRSLSGIFNSVRPRVRQLTGQAQQPVVTSRLNTDPVLIAAMTSTTPRLDPERELFLSAQTCTDYQTYLDRYPNGEFKALADTMLSSPRCEPATVNANNSISSDAAAEARTVGLSAYNREDYATALREWTRSCDGGNAKGCTSLGVLYEEGYGVTQDYAQARTLYQKGCEGGDAHGCTNLGFLYRNGYGVTQDYAQARTFYQKGCDGGNARGCTGLGVLYRNGYGVTQNYAQARTLYQKGCDGGNVVGCTNLGVLLYNGLGGPEDESRGADLVRKGCAGGSQWECDWLEQRDLSR